MVSICRLTKDEKRAFIHYVKNMKGNELASGQAATVKMLDIVCDDEFLKELAEVHEAENFALKNRYIHQKKTMNFAEKKRMPLDESTVRDMLRNQHIFRSKISKEIPSYTGVQESHQFQHGLLTYLREGAYGDLGDLVKEVGIKRDTIPFYNLTEYRKIKENFLHESDPQFGYLLSALFTPLDMTDYETQFVSWNELPGAVPLSKPNWLTAYLSPEKHPQTDAFATLIEQDGPKRYGTSQVMEGLVTAHYTELEPEEVECYGSEAESDDEEDYDEEGDGGEEEYGEEDYDEEEEDTIDEEEVPIGPEHDRFFRGLNDTVRGRYSEIEIEAFMKVLGIKPRV